MCCDPPALSPGLVGLLLVVSLACAGGQQPVRVEVEPAEPSAEPEPTPASSPLLDDWGRLLEAGCDPDAAKLHSPVVLRVLRNTPFAQLGRPFTSQDLDALYRSDGDWYQPSADGEHTLSDDAAACVARLREREQEALGYHCMKEGAREALTRSLAVYLWHRGGGVADLHRFKPQQPGWSACDPAPGPEDEEAFYAHETTYWTVTDATSPGVSEALLRAAWQNKSPVHYPRRAGEPPARERARFEGWDEDGASIHHLYWMAEVSNCCVGSQTFAHCLGPGPDEAWVCYDAGS
jgi:hypothetical protein